MPPLLPPGAQCMTVDDYVLRSTNGAHGTSVLMYARNAIASLFHLFVELDLKTTKGQNVRIIDSRTQARFAQAQLIYRSLRAIVRYNMPLVYFVGADD